MTAALSRGWRKGVRTAAQLAAGGALTALVVALAGGLSPQVQGFVMAGWTALVAFMQNWLETAGAIPTMLPTPGLIVSTGTPITEAVVAADVDSCGQVAGTVTDTGGNIVGEVVGQIGMVGGVNDPRESQP